MAHSIPYTLAVKEAKVRRLFKNSSHAKEARKTADGALTKRFLLQIVAIGDGLRDILEKADNNHVNGEITNHSRVRTWLNMIETFAQQYS